MVISVVSRLKSKKVINIFTETADSYLKNTVKEYIAEPKMCLSLWKYDFFYFWFHLQCSSVAIDKYTLDLFRTYLLVLPDIFIVFIASVTFKANLM